MKYHRSPVSGILAIFVILIMPIQVGATCNFDQYEIITNNYIYNGNDAPIVARVSLIKVVGRYVFPWYSVDYGIGNRLKFDEKKGTYVELYKDKPPEKIETIRNHPFFILLAKVTTNDDAVLKGLKNNEFVYLLIPAACENQQEADVDIVGRTGFISGYPYTLSIPGNSAYGTLEVSNLNLISLSYTIRQ